MKQSVFDRIGEAEFAKILSALGVDHNGAGSKNRIRCPIHGGDNNNFEIRWDKNIAQCYSGCGVDHFTISMLVEELAGIDHSLVGAFIEGVLDGTQPDLPPAPTVRRVQRSGASAPSAVAKNGKSDGDSLPPLTPFTVIDYLALKNIVLKAATEFGFVDCEIWDSSSKSWASCVLMPSDNESPHEWKYRPRVRSSLGTRFANKIRVAGRTTDTKDLPARLYGLHLIDRFVDGDSLIVVEGESDIHALRHHGFVGCVGVPGASWARKADLWSDMLAAGVNPGSVFVFSEPGDAGRKFPARVFEGMQLAGIRSPDVRVISLDGGDYGDVCDAHVALNGAGFTDFVNRCMDGAIKYNPEELSSELYPLSPWPAYEKDNLLVPQEVSIGGASFCRTKNGWSAVKHSDSGEEIRSDISSHIIPIESIVCGEEVLYDVLMWHGPMCEWVVRRVPQAALLSSEMTGQLVAMGLLLASPNRGSFTKMMTAYLTATRAAMKKRTIYNGSGWQDDGSFSGVDSESSSHLVENVRLCRTLVKNEDVAAKTHYDAARLLARPELWNANDRATLACALAVGASCCAPMLHPARAANSPVILLHGIGGGGKTVVQSLAASVWVDKTVQQPVFFQANVSQAALSVLALDARDLPMIVDDVMQMPSKRDTDAARIKAFAELAMLVFNREPIKRAKRDGSMREGNAFRSPMIASAEQSLTSSNARLSTGQMRRIIQIEGRPLVSCGVMKGVNEKKNMRLLEDAFYRDNCGVIGPRIVGMIRGKDRELHDMLRLWSQESRDANPEAEKTQMQTVALCCMGWMFYLRACGVQYDQAENEAKLLLKIAAGVGGTATTSDEAMGATRALESVAAYVASNRAFFQGVDGGATSTPITKGRILDDNRVAIIPSYWNEIEATYGITGASLRALADSGNLETQMESNGKFRLKKQVRIEGRGVRCYVFVLPGDGDDDDNSIFDPDLYSCNGNDRHLREASERKTEAGVCKPFASGAGASSRVSEECEERAGFGFEPKESTLFIDSNTYSGIVLSVNYFPVNTPIFDYDDHNISLIVPFRIDPATDREMIMDSEVIALWSHATGRYKVIDNSAKNDSAMHDLVLMEAREELVALQEMAVSVGVVCEDAPPDGDERWNIIDQHGPKLLTNAWVKANKAIRGGDGMLMPANVEYVKAYRLHILCRLRHPEWCIGDADD